MSQDLFRGTEFDEIAGTHHRNVGGDLRDHRQAVRNEYIGQPEFLLQFLQKQQNLRADRNVQRGNGFIGHNQFGPQDEGTRDPDALALAAGKFVRIFLQCVFGQSDTAKNFRSLGGSLRLR